MVLTREAIADSRDCKQFAFIGSRDPALRPVASATAWPAFTRLGDGLPARGAPIRVFDVVGTQIQPLQLCPCDCVA